MQKVRLRDYQHETLDALRDLLRRLAQEAARREREGDDTPLIRAVMLYAPTGAGKTEMAIALLQACYEKVNKEGMQTGRGAMLLDRIVLCDQTSVRLTKYNLDHGVMQSGHWRNRPYERIQVCSAQTLEKRGSFPGLNLLIIDEAHATRGATKEFIKNNPDVVVIGLSASPFTDGLTDVYAKEVVSVTTTAKLVESGNLVPLRVFVCKEVDMEGQKPKVGGEWTADQAESAGVKITGDVVSEWRSKCQEVFGGPRKTIVFCASVAHGAHLVKQFAEAGFNFVQLSYEDDEGFKREAIKDFSSADTDIDGLIAVDILTKGFDVPDVMVGVSVRPFKKSFSSHVQQMGRIMRVHPEDASAMRKAEEAGEPRPALTAKPFGLWLDHSGNYLRFRKDWEELYHEGVKELRDGVEKPKAEPSKEEKERAKCPKCMALWIGRSRVCSNCGYERPSHANIDEVKGVMEEVGMDAEAAATSRKKQREWWEQMRVLQLSRGKNDGLVAMIFKDKFGAWPPFGWRDEPLKIVPITNEVINYDKHRRLKWAKSAKKRA